MFMGGQRWVEEALPETAAVNMSEEIHITYLNISRTSLDVSICDSSAHLTIVLINIFLNTSETVRNDT
jgi:hypothetical protein